MTATQLRTARKEWCKRKNIRNLKIGRLSEAQHRALAILSCMRHNMHCNKEAFFDSGSHNNIKYIRFLMNSMPLMLEKAGLPPIYCSDIIQAMPDKDFCSAYKITGSYREMAKATCYEMQEMINDRIEDYLHRIDSESGTDYAPAGFLRLEA